MAKAALILEDGTVFQGASFAATGEALGEACFYTGVVGYQEAVTNPSYAETLLVLTYPIIGSYGVNDEDVESDKVQATGVVIRDYSSRYSNFRATGSFEDYLTERGVVGIRGIDTRAVVVHLRENGEMKGLIVSGGVDVEAALAKLKECPSPFEADLVGAPRWGVADGADGRRAAILDLGATKSLLAQIADLGFADFTPREDLGEVLAAKPRGLIVAGGPGDPNTAGGALEAVKPALGKLPVVGIGLGHEVLALALGCSVKRMKAGHHGVNHSVRILAEDRCIITVQHHSFVVVEDGLPSSVEVSHRNVNDRTVEGIKSAAANARGVQFHPSRDDMAKPSPILKRFLEAKDA